MNYGTDEFKLGFLNKLLNNKRVCSSPDFMARFGYLVTFKVNEDNEKEILSLVNDERFRGLEEELPDIIVLQAAAKTPIQREIKNIVFNNPELVKNPLFLIAAVEMIRDSDVSSLALNKLLANEQLCKNPEFATGLAKSFRMLQGTYGNNPHTNKFIDELSAQKEFCTNKGFSSEVLSLILAIGSGNDDKREKINTILKRVYNDDKIKSNETFVGNFAQVVRAVDTDGKMKIMNAVLDDEELYSSSDIMKVLPEVILEAGKTDDPEKEISDIISTLQNKELPVSQRAIMLDKTNFITLKQLRKLNATVGKENALTLSSAQTKIAIDFLDIYNKNDINEITSSGKKELLKALVSSNADLFNAGDEVKKLFPLIPTNQDEYCELLPALVRAMGIETKALNESEVKGFNKTITQTQKILKALSDEEFASVKISLQYDKNDFIKDVISKTKDLSRNERQKVYDYFGFELHHNKNNKTGYSITGYPVNLNNGEKLSKITDPKTRTTVESLRKNVIDFSQNNKITCSNKDLEPCLNEIVKVLPELYSQAGKIQAGMEGTKGSHEFDVFQHSIKVLQKIFQDPEFDKLDDSDKKVMVLASLLHDITKKEGSIDPTHPKEGSFDAFFTAKKFNLSRDEEIKLYTLIRHHEWLAWVNSSKNEDDEKAKIRSVSYDLRHDNNLFLAYMFTRADLKAVKKDDSFYDKKEGPSRKNYKGETRSFGEAAQYYFEIIQKNIEELKKSQPLLPVTKFPKASEISNAITKVNPDGSTNIKGVYKGKNGETVIKFNEIENSDWEKIGFPKNSVSKGIHAKVKDDVEVNTGNIKFFIHGLDYPNQLSRFDAFSLADSDALLSVSYAERPETKYRFFRPQGVILDAETKYIHGGGNTDSGSGYKKTIDGFKKDYIFGGYRESDRLYISNMIKEATGMDDEKYVQFIAQNENKPFCEIEPETTRNKIIKAFASINSNKRKGEREYNEMYVSNPKPPMGVFVYNTKVGESVGNPLKFLEDEKVQKRTGFLIDYALKNDVPIVVFGD